MPFRRETSNGIIPHDTNIRFTPAEMEMVRMLYQNGDKVLNTVNENNEPFYMQLEALMRRESNEKKMQLHENGHIGRLFHVISWHYHNLFHSDVTKLVLSKHLET